MTPQLPHLSKCAMPPQQQWTCRSHLCPWCPTHPCLVSQVLRVLCQRPLLRQLQLQQLLQQQRERADAAGCCGRGAGAQPQRLQAKDSGGSGLGLCCVLCLLVMQTGVLARLLHCSSCQCTSWVTVVEVSKKSQELVVQGFVSACNCGCGQRWKHALGTCAGGRCWYWEGATHRVEHVMPVHLPDVPSWPPD